MTPKTPKVCHYGDGDIYTTIPINVDVDEENDRHELPGGTNVIPQQHVLFIRQPRRKPFYRILFKVLIILGFVKIMMHFHRGGCPHHKMMMSHEGHASHGMMDGHSHDMKNWHSHEHGHDFNLGQYDDEHDTKHSEEWMKMQMQDKNIPSLRSSSSSSSSDSSSDSKDDPLPPPPPPHDHSHSHDHPDYPHHDHDHHEHHHSHDHHEHSHSHDSPHHEHSHSHDHHEHSHDHEHDHGHYHGHSHSHDHPHSQVESPSENDSSMDTEPEPNLDTSGGSVFFSLREQQREEAHAPDHN